MENKLTFSQQLILDCIHKYYDEHLEMPTLDDLCYMAGLSLKSTIHKHLGSLQKKYIIIKLKIIKGIFWLLERHLFPLGIITLQFLKSCLFFNKTLFNEGLWPFFKHF